MTSEFIKTLDGRASLQYTFSVENMDRISAEILLNAEIPGIIRPSLFRADEICTLTYKTAGLVTASDFLQSEPGAVFRLLRGICGAILAAENYLLECSPLLLSKDKIFVDRSGENVHLICIPDEKLSGEGVCTVFSAKEGLAALLNELNEIPEEDRDIKNAVHSAEEILNGIAVFSVGEYAVRLSMNATSVKKAALSEDVPSGPPEEEVDRILSGFEKIDGRSISTDRNDNRKKTTGVTGNGEKGKNSGAGTGRISDPARKIDDRVIPFSFLLKNLSFANIRLYLRAKMKRGRLPYTVRRSSDQASPAWLLRQSGEKRKIDILPFVVGKNTDCDLVCDGSRYLSHRHYEILYDGRSYLLRDLCSTNGTFLNGDRIMPGDQRMLSDGDVICAGDEFFVFIAGKSEE